MVIAAQQTERVDMEVAARNATGSDIGKNLLVSGHKEAITLPAATTSAVFGATTSVQKTLRTGSVAIRGKAILTAGVGGVTAGARVMPEAATGKAIAWTTGNAVAGIAQETVAADALFECELALGATGQ